jgi:hypothetical protein
VVSGVPSNPLQETPPEQLQQQFPPQIFSQPAAPPPVWSQPEQSPVALELRILQQRLDAVVKYIQSTVDFYIKQFSARIMVLEKTCAQLGAFQLRTAGIANLSRPDEGVPVDQIFTTNPNAGAPLGQGPYPTLRGNALDTGIAPTKAMVDAQANMTILEGVPVPGAQVAHPAYHDPNAPAYGFGWNQPRPPRR